MTFDEWLNSLGVTKATNRVQLAKMAYEAGIKEGKEQQQKEGKFLPHDDGRYKCPLCNQYNVSIDFRCQYYLCRTTGCTYSTIEPKGEQK